jgi:deazaflavin-dependent oxidoreductase (nitroreductase family)
MAERTNWNAKIIEEFRANGGKVGGGWAGRDLLLLTTTGAKSGQPHTNPVVFLRDGERLLIFGSKAGAPTHPDWYHNLVAHPVVMVEVGAERYEATATVLTGEERDQFYAKQAQVSPAFADYQKKTSRVIPVVALTRRTS